MKSLDILIFITTHEVEKHSHDNKDFKIQRGEKEIQVILLMVKF